MDSGGGGAADQSSPAELLQGKSLSGGVKNRLRAGAELLFLSRGVRGLSHRLLSGGGGLIEVPFLLLYHRLSHPVRGFAGTLHLRLSLPLRMVSGAAA